MTVKELTELHGFTAIALPSPDRKINGVYVGDLLSWVMGRARADDAWITIMSNINILAVAALSDVACIILTEGVKLDEEMKSVAEDKGVNVISSNLTSYEAAVELSKSGI